MPLNPHTGLFIHIHNYYMTVICVWRQQELTFPQKLSWLLKWLSSRLFDAYVSISFKQNFCNEECVISGGPRG